MLPKPFLPCCAPAGRSWLLLVPWANSRVVAGKFQTTQWINVPEGASGSSMIRAKLLVPGGGSVQESGGEVSAPSQVNSLGISPPFLNAVLCKANPMCLAPGCVWDATGSDAVVCGGADALLTAASRSTAATPTYADDFEMIAA